MLEVIGAEIEGDRAIPLYESLYSTRSPGFRSENQEIIEAIEKVRKGAGNKGIWVIDRGGDRKRLYLYLLERGLKFVIRSRGDQMMEAEEGKTQNKSFKQASVLPLPG